MPEQTTGASISVDTNPPILTPVTQQVNQQGVIPVVNTPPVAPAKPAPTIERVSGQQFKDVYVDPNLKPTPVTPPAQFPQPKQETVGVGGIVIDPKKVKPAGAQFKQQTDSYVEKPAPATEVKPSIPRDPSIKLLDLREEFYCVRCATKCNIKQECSVTIGDPVTKALKQIRGVCFTCMSELTSVQRGPRQTGTGV